MAKPKCFTYRIVDDGPTHHLELTNATRQTLQCVEVLTVFLKNEEAAALGPSQVHIRFEAIDRILPAEKSIMPHTIWINGKQAETEDGHLKRLQAIDGQANPYVLDISWQDTEGKTRFQRIPVGHGKTGRSRAPAQARVLGTIQQIQMAICDFCSQFKYGQCGLGLDAPKTMSCREFTASLAGFCSDPSDFVSPRQIIEMAQFFGIKRTELKKVKLMIKTEEANRLHDASVEA